METYAAENNNRFAQGGGGSGGGGSITTSNFNEWGFPTRVAVNEYEDRIEMLYKQQRQIVNHSFLPNAHIEDERVYKIVFSVKDGKLHKSEPIYGKIVPAHHEFYEFD